MPIINKSASNYVELYFKKQSPLFIKKRYASINLNGKVSDCNGEIIWCRHIASYWSEFFCSNSGKIDYEHFHPLIIKQSYCNSGKQGDK